ncbi:hypothetical protein NECAME_15044 [Necator americanus]|uniref:Uncharacterized protein n=1 Tax=Necator americanus TaxID=51031 RepID=W2SJS6_NECAM|nr:hypothetical protein NECAME_15044 [Necator americanus]ETN69850.1 hypothetical protein NECAME_15044 [Necator americanus]
MVASSRLSQSDDDDEEQVAASDASVRASYVQIVILVLFRFGGVYDSCNPVLPSATVPGFPPESGDSSITVTCVNF